MSHHTTRAMAPRAAWLAGLALLCGLATQAGGYEPEPATTPAPEPIADAQPGLTGDTLPERTSDTPLEPDVPQLRTLERPDPSARLPAGAKGSEYWDLVAKLDSGHVVSARFLLTNVGPGNHSAVVRGYVIAPDGEIRRFRNGRRRSRWRLSDDNLDLTVNKCRLDLHNQTARLEVRKDVTRIDLRFALQGGAIPPPGVLPPRYFVETLAANAAVEGQIQLAPDSAPTPVRGTGAVTHTWTSEAEEKRIARRLDFFTLTTGRSIQLSEFRTPSGRTTRWLRVLRDGRSELESTEVVLEATGKLSGTPRSYPVEGRLRIQSPGVHGSIELSRVIHQYDPLDAIPEPMQTLIRWSVKMQPHQVLASAPFELELESAAVEAATGLRGDGVALVGFLRKQ